MSRYKPYPNYQNSGVEWLGEVPEHWNLIRIGHLFKRTKVTDCVNEELLSVYRDYGVIPKSSRDDNNNKPSDDLTPYQLVLPGNLVMNKMKAWQGSIAISNYRGIVSPAYFVYTAEQTAYELIDDAYLHHLLRSDLYIVQYLRYSKGIRINQWDLDPDSFKALEVLLPPQSEQKLISNFINDEHAKIDTLIAKQERMIELLDEKRSAIISHAVTKGLDPDVPMKDSGVEWLGEVPEHWEIKPLKMLISKIIDNRGRTPQFGDTGIPMLEIKNITEGRRNPTSYFDKFVEEEIVKQFERDKVMIGDLLISTVGATSGKAVIIEEIPNFFIAQNLVGLRTNELIYASFLFYVLNSKYFYTSLMLINKGNTIDNLKVSVFINNICCVPSIEEQTAIANFLDIQTAKIDILITKARQAIELMKERRIALISAAVTGKIDVRGIH